MMLESYQNHFLCLAIYGGILVHSLPASKHSIGNFLLTSLAGLLSLSELKYMYQRRGMPPGISGSPIVGDFLKLFQDPIALFQERLTRYGTTYFTFAYLSTPTLLVSDNQDVEWVISQERQGKTSRSYPPHIQKVFGPNVIMVASGDFHKRLRRLMEPAFTRTATKSYIVQIDQAIQQQLTKWEIESKKRWLTLEDCKYLAMTVIVQLILPPAEPSVLEDVVQETQVVMKGVATAPINIPGTTFYKALQAKKRLCAKMKTIVANFKASFPEDSDEAQTTFVGRLCYSKDPKTGQSLSEQDLVDNLLIIVMNAFGSMGGTIGTMLYRYKTSVPESMQKALKEEVNDFSDQLDYNQLRNEAPLLNAFITEVWRRDPPASLHASTAKVPLTFRDTGYTIPKGSNIGFMIQDSAFSQQYKTPEEFRIERFLPTDHPLSDPVWLEQDFDLNITTSRNRIFGGGPHHCIGHDFARVEARIFVTRFLQKYEFELRNEQDVKIEKFPIRRYAPEFRITKS